MKLIKKSSKPSEHKKLLVRPKYSIDILIIFLIVDIVNFTILFFIDGPLWVLLCFTLWLNILYTFLVFFFFRPKKQNIEKPKQEFNWNKSKWTKLIRSAIITTIFTIMVVFIFLFANFSFILVSYPIMYLKADSNKAQLQTIVSELTKNSLTDKEKTINILNWFERYSGNMHNIWGTSNFGVFYFGKDLPNGWICCVRTDNRNPALWVLTSRSGACDEHSALFREMANAAGLKVRSVICHEVDHVWDEVYIGDKWVIVDPSNVIFRSNISRYNLPADSFEKTHAGRTHNISYVFAEYPNKTTEDITYRYAGNLSNINLTIIDENFNPVPKAEITVLSNNKKIGAETGLVITVNDTGRYLLKIGGGDLTLVSKTNVLIPLYNATTQYFVDGKNYNLTIILKNDWTQNPILFITPIVILFLLIFLIVLYFFFKRRNKLDKQGEEDINMISEGTKKILNAIIVGSLLAFGIILIIIGFTNYMNEDLILMLAIDSIGVSCIGLGIAFESIFLGEDSVKISQESSRIAVESRQIAENSDKRVNDIANANFLGVVSEIEDRRIEIQHFPAWRRINVWKSFVYVQQAQELLNFCDILPRHQGRLNNVFNHLLELIDFGYLYTSDICCEEVAHLLRMYQTIINLDSEAESQADTNTLIRVLFDLSDNDEMNIDVVNILLERIKDFEYEDLFLQNRDEITNYSIIEG